MASRPHGNPPQGNRSCTASCSTHQPATASGQARSRSSGGRARVSTAKMTASTTVSVTHAYQATLTSHDSSARKKTAPQISPAAKVARRPLRHTASVSSAGPTMARGQKPTGGKAPARASPAAKAAARDHQRVRPGQPLRPGAIAWSGAVATAGAAWSRGGFSPRPFALAGAAWSRGRSSPRLFALAGAAWSRRRVLASAVRAGGRRLVAGRRWRRLARIGWFARACGRPAVVQQVLRLVGCGNFSVAASVAARAAAE